jgi:hypothetical protein
MLKRGSITAVLLAVSLTGGAAALAQQATRETAPGETQEAFEQAVDEAREATQRLAEKPIVFNGGISLEERAAAPQEGTKLEFFLKEGAYLSDVHVVVADEAGEELVNTVTDGPWLILDLPDGQYNVQASLGEDSVQSGKITVDSRTESFGYMFPSEQN